jgi:hypothetical protein
MASAVANRTYPRIDTEVQPFEQPVPRTRANTSSAGWSPLYPRELPFPWGISAPGWARARALRYAPRLSGIPTPGGGPGGGGGALVGLGRGVVVAATGLLAYGERDGEQHDLRAEREHAVAKTGAADADRLAVGDVEAL